MCDIRRGNRRVLASSYAAAAASSMPHIGSIVDGIGASLSIGTVATSAFGGDGVPVGDDDGGVSAPGMRFQG